MILSWWTAILMFLGLVPKAVEVGEDVQAKRILDESARNRAEAEADARPADSGLPPGVRGP